MDSVVLNNEEFKQSSPEYSFYHKVWKFFEEDPDIDVGDINKTNCEFTITVHDRRKFEILKELLCIPKNTTRLNIIIECDADKKFGDSDLAYLLESNPYFSRFEGDGALMKYVLMKPTVVQYYDDIANNPWGTAVKTAEEIAKELFRGSHCNITTDLENNK